MKKIGKEYGWTDKAAAKIAGMGIRVQSKFAGWMSKQTNDMSAKKIVVLVSIFCAFWVGLSAYYIITAIRRVPQDKVYYEPDPILSPKHFDQPEDEIIQPIVTQETYDQIQSFKNSLEYDSLIMARPGLLDSIKLLEEIYHSQNK